MSVRNANEESVDGTTGKIPDVPGAPASVSAVDVGTSRAFGNGAATVTISPNTTYWGDTTTGYTVTSTPGGFSASGTSPVTVTGLSGNTSYTFTAVSTNATGTGSESTTSSAITATTVPDVPVSVTATNQGSTRAYNNGQASVAFTAGNNGGKTVSSFTVTSSPGGYTASGATSPLIVTGLQSATAYTYTVTATNANGTSNSSSASASVTATTVPQAPTIGTATGTNSTTVSLTFTANATGGSVITGYTAVSNPSISLSTSGTTSPVTITGTFAGDTAYTFTLAAVNANGTSTASSSSNSITPYAIPKFLYFGHGESDNFLDKVAVPTDTVSALTATLSPSPYQRGTSFANSPTAGYYGAGLNVTSDIKKLTFSSDTVSLLSTKLSLANQYAPFGFANSGTAGYFAGGSNNGASYYTRLDKLTFSNDTNASLGNVLSPARDNSSGNGAASNNGTAGYWAGGYGPTAVATAQEKLNYSNDSRSAITAVTYGGGITGLANSGTAGYYSGGYQSTQPTSYIQKITFSNDTPSVLSNRLARARNAAGSAASHNGVAGYFANGNDSAGQPQSHVDKMSFSTETSALMSSNLTYAGRYGALGFANSGTL